MKGKKMTPQTTEPRHDIEGPVDLESLELGDPLHVETNGKLNLKTNEARFAGRMLDKKGTVLGLVVNVDGKNHEVRWGQRVRVSTLSADAALFESDKEARLSALEAKLGVE